MALASTLRGNQQVGIYNRDYYRGGGQGGFFDGGIPTAVKGLLIANIVVFVLQMLVIRDQPVSARDLLRRYQPQYDKLLTQKEKEGPDAVAKLKEDYPEIDQALKQLELQAALTPDRVSIVQEWFELDTAKVMQGQVWRLLTSAFCHDRYSLWHILFNMLLLYWFGCTLELIYGSREFLLFYLMAALTSSVAFVGLDLYTGSRVPAVGASGAVMGVLMVYTMLYPRQEIRIFWLFPVEMRWVMLLYLIYDLHPVLLAMGGDEVHDGVAHACHLGGLAFGFLYYKQQWRLEDLFDGRASKKLMRAARGKPTLKVYREPDVDMDRLDDLLKKIKDEGKESLSEEENEFLRETSARMKKRQD